MSAHSPDDEVEAFFGGQKPKTVEQSEDFTDSFDPPTELPQGLSSKARRALQRLLIRGSVFSRTHEDLFQQLVVNRARVSEVLSELNLAMLLNEESGLAVLKRSGDRLSDETEADQDEDSRSEDAGYAILRATHLKLLHSLVLMVLWMHFRDRKRQGDDLVQIDLKDLEDRLRPYWPLLNAENRSDRALKGAIAAMEDYCILVPIRGAKDQREVSPAVLIALNAENAQIMVDEYARLSGVEAGKQGAIQSGESNDE